MMTQIQIAEARAPYVMFEQRAVEDRAETIRTGAYATKDVDYALITPQGSRDQVERVASEWFESMGQEVRAGRFPAEWLKAFKFAYGEWKEGREMPVNGTPIVNWAVLSPSQVQALKKLHVLTVESLAEANEEILSRLGMGGRNLKQLAQDFISGKDPAGAAKLAADLGVLRVTVEEQTKQINGLIEANRMLMAQVQAPAANNAAVSADMTAGMQSSDLFDDPAPVGRKL